jgi:hypothetical protein
MPGDNGLHCTAAADGLRQPVEEPHALLPVEAGIGDRLAAAEILPRHEILPAVHEVALYHQAYDPVLARLDLKDSPANGTSARFLG